MTNPIIARHLYNHRSYDVIVYCPLCNERKVFEVPEQGYKDWQAGELIQKAMPDLSSDDRERLISGICPKCWDKQFPPEDE